MANQAGGTCFIRTKLLLNKQIKFTLNVLSNWLLCFLISHTTDLLEILEICEQMNELTLEICASLTLKCETPFGSLKSLYSVENIFFPVVGLWRRNSSMPEMRVWS